METNTPSTTPEATEPLTDTPSTTPETTEPLTDTPAPQPFVSALPGREIYRNLKALHEELQAAGRPEAAAAQTLLSIIPAR